MNIATLPPAPNWCLDNILVCASDKTIAWGAKDTIVIANPSPDDENILTYRYITNAHKERVTSLAFSPEYGKNNKFLLSSGDDNVVKIWNLEDLSIAYCNSALDSKQKIIAVDWFKKESPPSWNDTKGVCYVSEEGQLVYWNLTCYQNWTLSLGKMTATCLSCCPHDSYTVAVGSKNGLLYIIDTRRSGTIIYRCRGHNSQIVSLSWCPVPKNVLDDSDEKHLLLASGAKDRTIYIWRAGGDGRYETIINLPSNVLDGSRRPKLSSGDRYWTALKWVSPKVLLSSSSWGELLSWNLSLLKSNLQAYELVHASHAQGLYCIATEPHDLDDDNNWRTKTSYNVWTVSKDRQVICCNIEQGSNTIKYIIPAQSGFVYCMAACPLDTSVIAFGVGDKVLRIWNLSESHKNTINVTMIWQNIMGKIRALAWHPDKENLLAFGTEEGRVGILDTNHLHKHPVLLKPHNGKTIYSIVWGPIPEKPGFDLYVAGYKELVYYDSDKPEKDPVVLKVKNSTDFSWKPNYSCIVIGFEDGSIKFYSKEHVELGKTVHIMNKAIYCLAWHPESTASDVGMSSMQNYLAIAGDYPTVTILDVFNVDKVVSYKTVCKLNGHNEKVVSLAWSPYITGQLLTASYDKTVQIWKVETQEIMKTFDKHDGPVLCCMWSPMDPDYAISGSMDFSLRVWKISDQKAKLPAKAHKTKPKKSKSKSPKPSSSSSSSSVSNKEEKVEDLTVVGSCQDVIDCSDKPSSVNESVLNKKAKAVRDEYFELYRKSSQCKESFLSSVRNIMKRNNPQNSDRKRDEVDDDDEVVESDEEETASIFYDRIATANIVEREVKSLKQKKNHKQVMELDVWRNNLRQHLEEAMKEKRLNDYLVSLTPSISYKTWQEACMVYAMQLVSVQEYKKAVTYMLVVNKINEAIAIYMEAKMYKEAYVLATCRLDPDHPILNEILREWTNLAIKRGAFEEAVQCLTKLGDYAAAAKLVGRRDSSLACLELSIELAVASQDIDLVEAQAEETIKKSLLAGNCQLALSLVEKFAQVGCRELLVQVCTKILEISKCTYTSKSVCDYLLYGHELGLIEHFEQLYGKEKLAKFFAELKVRDFSVEVTNELSLWVYVSHQLSLAISTDSNESRLKYIAASLGMISHFELTNSQANKQRTFLIGIILSLNKKSLLDKDNLFNDHELESSKSLRAYLCLAILTWFAWAEDAADYVETVAKILKDYIPDVFDQKAVNYWTMNTKIDKIEAQLSSAMGKKKLESDSETKDQDEVQELVEKLNEMKLEKKEFTDLRVCVPNPVVAYCVALEFGNKITNEDTALQFNGPLKELWNNLQI